MGVPSPHRRDTAAFQLATVLEELDLEVARIQLNPRARTLLASRREYAEKTRGLCERLGIPAAAPEDLETALKVLAREIGKTEGATNLTACIADVRQVTHAMRAVCIAIVAKSSRLY
jgi:hypothetical protein